MIGYVLAIEYRVDCVGHKRPFVVLLLCPEKSSMLILLRYSKTYHPLGHKKTDSDVTRIVHQIKSQRGVNSRNSYSINYNILQA
jgi:hypothetical protein